MKKLVLLFLFFYHAHLWALLINEDGNQVFSSIILGKSHRSNAHYQAALLKESIKIIHTSKYEWAQDIYFSNKQGEILLMPNYPEYTSYFSDFTLGVFESYGGKGELLRVREEDVGQLNMPTQQMHTLYLEGGASISGQFKNGENYLIIREERFVKSKLAFESVNGFKITDSHFKEKIFEEYKVLPQNLFLLPFEVGTEHLDLFIKAMPDGELVIDNPEDKITFIERLMESSRQNRLSAKEENYLKGIIEYEKSSHFRGRRDAYNRKISLTVESLKKKFKIHFRPARFFHVVHDQMGRTYISEETNFLNSVNGINKVDGEKYFFTNRSNSNLLMENWAQFISSEFQILKDRVYFVAEYSDGAGLDCMGALIGEGR